MVLTAVARPLPVERTALALPRLIVDAGAHGRRAVPGVLRGADREPADAAAYGRAVGRFLARRS